MKLEEVELSRGRSAYCHSVVGRACRSLPGSKDLVASKTSDGHGSFSRDVDNHQKGFLGVLPSSSFLFCFSFSSSFFSASSARPMQPVFDAFLVVLPLLRKMYLGSLAYPICKSDDHGEWYSTLGGLGAPKLGDLWTFLAQNSKHLDRLSWCLRYKICTLLYSSTKASPQTLPHPKRSPLVARSRSRQASGWEASPRRWRSRHGVAASSPSSPPTCAMAESLWAGLWEYFRTRDWM